MAQNYLPSTPTFLGEVLQAFLIAINSSLPYFLSFMVFYVFLQWILKTRRRKTKSSIRVLIIILSLFTLFFLFKYSGELIHSSTQEFGATFVFALFTWLATVNAFRVKDWVSVSTKSAKKKIILASIFNFVLVIFLLTIEILPVKFHHVVYENLY